MTGSRTNGMGYHIGSLWADMRMFYFGHRSPSASVPMFSGAVYTLPRKAAYEAARHYEEASKSNIHSLMVNSRRSN